MKANPLVSVCIPVYNGEKYIGTATESVLAQTFKQFELIIVDNNSSDNTAAIIKKYTDDRIVYYKNPSTVSMGDNWNKCLSLCSGKYVCLLHADDSFLPDMLEEELKIIEGDEKIGFVFSGVNYIDENGRLVSERWPFKNDYIAAGANEFKKHIFGNYIHCPSVMVRKECYDRVGGYKGSLRYFLDWDMWLRIELSSYKVAYISKILANYRIHSASATSTFEFIETPNETEEIIALIKDNFDLISLNNNYDKKTRKELLDKVLARYLLRSFRLMINHYLRHGRMDYITKTLRYLLFNRKWEKEFHPTFGTILMIGKFVLNKIIRMIRGIA